MATPFLLAPGFSRVSAAVHRENRFNGFPHCLAETVEMAVLCSALNTRLKPGANEMALKEVTIRFSNPL